MTNPRRVLAFWFANVAGHRAADQLQRYRNAVGDNCRAGSSRAIMWNAPAFFRLLRQHGFLIIVFCVAFWRFKLTGRRLGERNFF
jgi:hypothetical protein